MPRVSHIANSLVKTLLHNTMEAIGTLGDVIARDNDVEKRSVSYIMISLSLYMYQPSPSYVRHSVSSFYSSFTEQWKLW